MSLTRRGFFHRMSGGMCGAALTYLLSQELWPRDGSDEPMISISKPRQPAFSAQGQSVIHLFMNGGPSQMDLFDPKPDARQASRPGLLRQDRRRGRDHQGRRRADAQPVQVRPARPVRHVGLRGDAAPRRQVDDIAFIRSMYTTNLTHEPAVYLIQSGKMGPGRPTLGLVGRLRPGQREPEPAGLRRARRPAGAAGQRRRELAGRLPAADVPGHALPLDRLAGPEPASPTCDRPPKSCRAERDLLAGSTRSTSSSVPRQPTSTPASPATSWPRACSWRRPTPWTSRKESQTTQEMYGIGREPTDSYGRRCLIARRLVERGVRFVQLYINGQIWDNHTALATDLKAACDRTDQPIAALLADLKQRGLARQHAGGLGRRVRPAADRPVAARQGRAQGRPRPQQERLLHLDGRRRRQRRNHLRRHRRTRPGRRREPRERARLARDDPAPARACTTINSSSNRTA